MALLGGSVSGSLRDYSQNIGWTPIFENLSGIGRSASKFIHIDVTGSFISSPCAAHDVSSVNAIDPRWRLCALHYLQNWHTFPSTTVYWSHKSTLIKCETWLLKYVNIWSQSSLGVILEGGYSHLPWHPSFPPLFMHSLIC